MALTECLTDVAHIAAIFDALLRMTSILDRLYPRTERTESNRLLPRRQAYAETTTNTTILNNSH